MSTDPKNSATRHEKDSIGPKEIPANVYYGIQTARAVENFPISEMRAHPTLIRAFGMVKEAAAEANLSLGLIDEKVAKAIIQSAREVQAGKFNDQFVVDVFQAGAGVSFHMNSNEVIANRAIEILGGKLGDYSIVHPNDHVNYGQSTNDVFPTGMRLAALLELEKMFPVLDAVRPAQVGGGLALLSLIYEKFARGERESATPGVGLGLTISRAIAAAHRGRIWAENIPSGGARFVVALPLGTPPEISRPPEEQPASPSPAETT